MKALIAAVLVATLRSRLNHRAALREPHECLFETVGIMRDGSVIEHCPGCTRVHIYMITPDGEPLGIFEIQREPDEEVGDAILRAYGEKGDAPLAND